MNVIKKIVGKINIKAFSIACTVFYILSIIPLLVISFYNWPTADDMSLALKTYQYYNETGNVLGVVGVALKVGLDEYLSWMGYFFSNVMFCFSPSIFGERWAALVCFEMLGILTFGVCYFMKSVFVYWLKADKHLANIVSMITLTIIVQSMPAGLARVEAFYWFSGAINYMFMFSMGLFWLGLLIRIAFTDDKKARGRKLFWACFWGFWMGGANYMTALEMAMCSVILLLFYVLGIRVSDKDNTILGRFKTKFGIHTLEDATLKENLRLIWLPAVVNLAGFAASVLAPGNATREALVEGFEPIKSIFIALYYVFSICINDYTRWEVIAAFVLLVPVCWKIAGEIKVRFRHPFIFTVIAYGFTASNMVPPLYALANIEAGRLRSIIWAEYALMMVLVIFYITVWARQSLSETISNPIETSSNLILDNKSNFSQNLSAIIVMCLLFLAFGSVLSMYTTHNYYSASSAVSGIVSGHASTYLAENEERLAILKDESITDAVLKPYSDRPEILAFDDITDDKDYWINRVMARYYGKDSVVLETNINDN